MSSNVSTCPWTASSNSSWLLVTTGTSGEGSGTVGYSVAGNGGGARTGSLTVAGQQITFNQAAAVIPPSETVVQAVLNGASYSGNIAPGTWVSIYGTQLATTTATASSVPLQTSLDGVSVSFGGIAAPLFYVSQTQINAVAPFELAVPRSTVPDVVKVPVVVTTTVGPSAPLNVSLSRESPGLFTLNGEGTGSAIAFDSNFNPVSVIDGGPIVLYAAGLGPTNPPASSASGGASAEPLNRVVDNVSVFIGTLRRRSYSLVGSRFPYDFINST